MENGKVEETQITVRFKTKLPAQLRVPETAVTVPASLTRYGLSQIINHLLQLDPIRPFDFLVSDELVRQTLEEVLLSKGLSAELVLDIEYITAVLPPKNKEQLPHDDWVSCVDGRQGSGIISGSFDGIVRLWTASGESAGSFSAHRGRVTAVAQLPVGQGVGLALTAGQDCAARLWKLPPPEASGNAEDPDSRKKKGGPVKGPAPELLAVYKGHTDSVAALAVSPAGERFASGGWDSGIHIWRTAEGIAGQSVVEAAEEARASGAVSAGEPRKKRAKSGAAGGDDSAPAASKLGGALESPSQGLLAGHTQCVSSVAWPTARSLVSGSWDHSVRRWDVNTGVNIDTLNTGNAVYAVATAPNDANGVVAFGGAEKALRFWDSRAQHAEQLAVRACSSHTDWILALAWSPTSDYLLVTASQDKTMKMWDVRSQVPLHTINSHTDKVLCVSWLGSGRIASGGADSALRICEVEASDV